MSAAKIYSPNPNLLERRFAAYLAQRDAKNGTADHASRARVRAISRVTKWCVGLSALAGIISGGVLGGTEIWMRHGIFDGRDDVAWQESLPYWTVFFIFAGVLSAVEIVFLYALSLRGIARVTQHAGAPPSDAEAHRLVAHGLARAALELPSPRVQIYGVDPYAHVSKWKLTVLNIAYKMKVGISSFILRIFLRRVAARMAIRGMVPLFAGPLYAVWNAYIIWRIMIEARLRTLGPLAVDTLMATHFEGAGDPGATETGVILHAAGEMLSQGRDAHPNQIYLMACLRKVLKHDEDIALDWAAMRRHLPGLDPGGQTRVLDLLTVSCVIGTRIRKEQTELLRSVCRECGAVLHQDRVKDLHKAIIRGDPVTGKELATTRSEAPSCPAGQG